MATSCMALSHSSKALPVLSCELFELCKSRPLCESSNGARDGAIQGVTGGASDNAGEVDDSDGEADKAPRGPIASQDASWDASQDASQDVPPERTSDD